MKSFKYKGTPEQMKKVEEYLLSKGAKDYDNIPAQRNYLCFYDDCEDFCIGGFQYLCYDNDFPDMPPELELEIFGSTESITGKIENPWIENTGVMPIFFYDKCIDLMLSNGDILNNCVQTGFMWGKEIENDGYLPITHWRYSKPDEDYFVQPTTPPQEDKGRVINMTEAIEIAKASVPEENAAKGPVKSDGGSTSYYQLTIKTKNGTFQCETGDVIAAMVGDNFPLGNAVKAIRRIYQASLGMGKEGIDMEYGAKKIAYFLRDFIDRSKL